MKTAGRLFLLALSVFLILAATAAPVRAATYLPLPDTDLARRSPVIVLARVVDQSPTLSAVAGEQRPFTLTTLETIDTLKGTIPARFQVLLPGGVSNGLAWLVPGTPSFELGADVVLFLDSLQGKAANVYRLTEFGLSKFDVAQDRTGRQFAIRPAFTAETDDYLSGRASAPGPVPEAGAPPRPLRDLESFLDTLRAIGQGAKPDRIEYVQPQGQARSSGGARPLFVNIGGREPGDCGGTPCLFRWFWDTGTSPNAVVFVTGTQTNLTDGSNGITHVQNAVDKWRGVPGSDVRTSGVSASGARTSGVSAVGNLNVKLDKTVSDDGTTWTTPLPCAGGVLGLGGPDASPPAPGPFKGDSTYYAIRAGTVQMRKSTCGSGYTAAAFRSGVLHEVGHTLGLGHPDQGQSTHSTTTSADWNNAVMRSSIPPALPDTPQTDDIQAIQFYYPGAGAPCVADATTFCASGNRFKVQTQYNTGNSTAGGGPGELSARTSGAGQAVSLTSDTGYFWFFASSNVEIVIKVVDGRAFNSRFWVFAAGLTNVNVVITVTDTVTGAVKTYTNPLNTAFAPIQDTSAFAAATSGEGSLLATGDSIAGMAEAISAELAETHNRAAGGRLGVPTYEQAEAPCLTSATALCLGGSRFKAEVTWLTSAGQSGAGQAVAITSDTGYFWFFSSANVEMVLKVVDGRGFNSRFWVFAAGLTNVNVVITVTDTLTGAVKIYTNPLNTAFVPIQDTSAFLP